jgi:hypothetical protein
MYYSTLHPSPHLFPDFRFNKNKKYDKKQEK